MKMYSFIVSSTLLFLGTFFFLASEASATTSSSAYASKVARYASVAQSTVDKYVARLESLGYTDEQIVTSLESRKASYMNKKTSKSYRGAYKYQIDAIISAIEKAIEEYEGGYIVYDDFDTPDPYVPPMVCSQEIKVCSDGSYVSRSGPRCEFATCPTVSPVRENYVTAVSNSMIYNTVYSRFSTSSSSYYKEYDVYVFTPTMNGNANSQMYAGFFISGPEKLIYNNYNSYTITTQFQPTYDKQKVATIRSQIPTSGYSLKKSITLSSQSQESFGVLTSENFNQHATKTFGDIYYYETYFLYIAKDNSEAFTLRYAQTGKKSMMSNMQIANVSLVGMTHSATLTYKNPMYSSYTLMYYTPSLYSDISLVRSRLGINTTSTWNYNQNISWGVGHSDYYSINGYKVDSSTIQNVKSYFRGVMSVNPTAPSSIYTFHYGLRSQTNFDQVKMSDGAIRTYFLLVSPDDREAYLTEFTQYAPYTY